MLHGGFMSLSAPVQQKLGRPRLSLRQGFTVGTLAAFYAVFVYGGAKFYAEYAADHSWSEMLLNYQGGFLKRSLLGEVAFHLHPLIAAQTFISLLLTALYLAVATWLILLATQRLTFASLLFLASPATLLFPVHDHGAFGRKDIIILAAFALSAYIVRRASSPTRALALIMVTYTVAGLIIETVWFYMPMAIMLLVFVRRPDLKWQMWAAAAVLVYAALITPLAMAQPLNDPRPGIIASWSNLGTEVAQYALCCITLPVNDAMGIATQYAAIAGWAYALSLALALIPTAALIAESERSRINILSLAGLAVAVAFMFGPMMVAADWGRYIYLLAVHSFAFAALTLQRRDDAGIKTLALSAVIASVYGLTWVMPLFMVGIERGWLLQR